MNLFRDPIQVYRFLIGLMSGFVLILVFLVSRCHRSVDAASTLAMPRARPDTIPRRLIQTTHLDHVPEHVTQGYDSVERIVMNDAQIETYLTENFHPRVIAAYRRLGQGAHRADLFRYCYLFREGGIYLDIKTYPVSDINEVFPDVPDTYTWYTALCNSNRCVYNAVIATPPNNPVMFDLIRYIVATVESGRNFVYWDFISYNLRVIKDAYGVHGKPGTYEDGAGRRLVLMQEKLSGARGSECFYPNSDEFRPVDRYGFCSNVYDAEGKFALVGRDPAYPWK